MKEDVERAASLRFDGSESRHSPLTVRGRW